MKTLERTRLPDQHWTFSDPMTSPSGGPAWAVGSAILMIGLTHPDPWDRGRSQPKRPPLCRTWTNARSPGCRGRMDRCHGGAWTPTAPGAFSQRL